MRTMPNGIPIVTTGLGILVLAMTTVTQASPGVQYRHWAGGRFAMPKALAEVRTPDGLGTFLASKDEFTRMAAVRRLGELGEAKAVEPLLELYQKEPAANGLNGMPLVKLEVIRTLGRVDTNEARGALVGILKGCWQQGPKVRDKRGYRLDRDFAPVMSASLRTLSQWSDNREVFELVKAIALSNDVKDYYTYPEEFGQLAWEAYLKGRLAREGIKNEEDAALTLFRFIEKLPILKDAGTVDFIKKRAACAVLSTYSEKTLLSLTGQFQREIRQIPDSSKGEQTSRCIQLRARTSFIKTVLRNRKEVKPDAASVQTQEPPDRAKTGDRIRQFQKGGYAR
jgi:hypothetical protein